MQDQLSSDEILNRLQEEAFSYFLHETNPKNGLVADNTSNTSPANIAAVGLALSAYIIGVERGFISRRDAIQRILTTLRFFHQSNQSRDIDATGYKGFYYHFLDKETGKRAGKCELSTIDTAFLLAGMLTTAVYFIENTKDENEIRQLAYSLYERVDWIWAQNNGASISHGWKPEDGFLKDYWQGYDEALFMYILALGSPTHPATKAVYSNWTSTYEWRNIYGQEFLYSGPLFTHQISQLWIDLREIKDDFMRSKEIDYFINTKRATYVQHQYAIENPNKFVDYGEHCWGITASYGPGPAEKMINHRHYKFYGYVARGVPDGPDDGTIAPWVVLASIPFTPELVFPTLRYFEKIKLRDKKKAYGYKTTFNQTYLKKSKPWISPNYYGINQGPIVLMIENYRNEFLWKLMRTCPYIKSGLRRANFMGGWLDAQE